MHVALDGPAGAGKSTIATKTANALGYTHIDTGAMYRAVTYIALKKGIDVADEFAYDFLDDLIFSFQGEHLFLNGDDVSSVIRAPEISANVSMVSSHLVVREHLVRFQQQLAKDKNVVMDGRDIGTKVLPQADVKIYLTASIDERARRRHQDNIARNIPSDLKELKQEIKRRDQFDTTRKHSPLTPADDAVLLDTSTMTIDEVVHRITLIIREVENYGV